MKEKIFGKKEGQAHRSSRCSSNGGRNSLALTCEGRTKKIFSRVFVWTWTRAPHHAVRRVWNQCKALYGIRCKTVWNRAAENAPSVIPCSYGDTIHADAWLHTKPAAWIKKIDKSKLVDFFGGDGGSRTHVLLGCQKTFYILILPIFLNRITRINALYTTQTAK